MNDFASDQNAAADLPPIRELSKPQRRVLGTLVEKAFTVPESYPMTLKGLTVGCNQKSNRSPMSSYSEDAALDALDELRALGLVAVVHTESGRTERYRHYTRKRFPFTEPQLAIMTELLLRGEQQLGELRARASRMVPIESLEALRQEIDGLIEQNYVIANGPLERRGVEVDHCFYLPGEISHRSSAGNQETENRTSGNHAAAQTAIPVEHPVTSSGVHSDSPLSGGLMPEEWTQQLAELRDFQRDLRSEIEELRQQLTEVKESVADLRHSLGA